MAENEYLAKIQAAVAEAENKKKAHEEKGGEEQVGTPDREAEIQEGLKQREASISEAGNKHEEAQALHTELAAARDELRQYQELAPKMKELGIEDPAFEMKFVEAEGRVADLADKVGAAEAGEKQASAKAGGIEQDPEIIGRLHAEALKENEARDLGAEIEKKQKAAEDTEAQIEETDAKIAELGKEIAKLNQEIQVVELVLEVPQKFDGAMYKLGKGIAGKIQASEQELASIEQKIKSLPKKMFGMVEDKAGKAALSLEQSNRQEKIRMLQELGKADLKNPGEQNEESLKQEFGEDQTYADYLSAKEQYDELTKRLDPEELKRIGLHLGQETGEFYQGRKEQLTKERAGKASEKETLTSFVKDLRDTVLPQIKREIEGLRQQLKK